MNVKFTVSLNRHTTKSCTENWRSVQCVQKLAHRTITTNDSFYENLFHSKSSPLTWKIAHRTRLSDDALCTDGKSRFPFVHYQGIHWDRAVLKAFSCNAIKLPFALLFNVKAFNKNHIRMKWTLWRWIVRRTGLPVVILVVQQQGKSISQLQNWKNLGNFWKWATLWWYVQIETV
jgi:hypothetical protein